MGFKLLLYLFFLLFINISQCFSQFINPSDFKEKIKVACIGNSITFGSGIPNRIKDSYPAQLAQMLGKKWDVRNFGVSGRTMLNKGDYPYAKEEAFKNALAFKPDIAIIKLGTNDSKPWNWKYNNEFENDYISLIKSFQEVNPKIKIYLCKPVPAFQERWGIRDSVIRFGVVPVVEMISNRMKLSVIDLYSTFLGKSEFFPDKIHPDALGSNLMAKLIYKSLTGKDEESREQLFPGVKGNWKGFNSYEFDFNGRYCRVVCPEKPMQGNPWIWNARFPEWHFEMDTMLLRKGFHVVYINTDDLLGGPECMKIWDNLYYYLTKFYNFNRKVALEAVSRGGLYVYNWAKQNPKKVSCIYAEAPVCDIKSWPGGKGKCPGNPDEWKAIIKLYNFKSEAEAIAFKDNPIDNLKRLADERVPILHTIGLNDSIVANEENTFVLADRYVKLGGIATVYPCIKGKQELKGHHFPIESPEYIVNFVMSNTQPINDDLNCSQFHNLRSGLKNSLIKFEREKKGRVAFLGGSITSNSGWRDKICEYLQVRFPRTKFEFINAGIPSTGSTPGAFRLEKDVLAKGKIDLLFEEAAVNDETNLISSLAQIRGMEGIVRHAREKNPKIDIVLLYFVDPSKMEKYNKGEIPEVIKNHEKVAEYYNIPSINLALEVTERINAGEFNWNDDFRDLHPSPFGQNVYSNSIKSFFENTWSKKIEDTDKIIDYSLTSKSLDEFSYSNGSLENISNAKIINGWNIDSDWIPEDNAGTREGFVKVPMLVSEKSGSEFVFDFNGSAFGIFVASGPDAGIIEYSIDNGKFKTQDIFTPWSKNLHIPWLYILESELSSEKHQIKVRISNKRNPESKGNACRIVYFAVNK